MSFTQTEVKALFSYDPETGVIYRRGGVGSPKPDPTGYVRFKVRGRMYLGHRLAWLWMTGAWPSAQIDHRNGVRDDNRWSNLREATNAENHQNWRRCTRNTSGYTGVSFCKCNNNWRAVIRVKRVIHRLGRFATPELAYAAYLEAKANLHPFQPIPRDRLEPTT